MNHQTTTMVVLGLGVLLGLAPAVCGADEFTHRFGADPVDPQLLKFMGPADARSTSRSGLQITMPVENTPEKIAGVRTAFPVEGDFEVTLRYELVEFPPPEQGFGTGVIVRLRKNESREFAALGHRRNPAGENVFNVNNTTLVEDEPRMEQQYFPTEASRGRLRLVREGDMLSYQVAEGDAADFRELWQVEFGSEPLRTVHFLAETGGSEQPLIVLLEDLSVRADGVSVPTAAPVDSPAPPPQKLTWLTWPLLGFGCLVLLLAALILFGRKRGDV